jgi:hypothetical protein
VQELLKYGDPFLLGILAPLMAVIALGLIAYVLPGPAQGDLGRWFPRGNRLAQGVAVLIMLVIFGLTILSIFQRR